jgi:hypothetical protein
MLIFKDWYEVRGLIREQLLIYLMYEAIGILFLSGLSEVLNHELDHHEMQLHEIKDILQIYDE